MILPLLFFERDPMSSCVSKGCLNRAYEGSKYCGSCSVAGARLAAAPAPQPDMEEQTMAQKYPQYYKPIPSNLSEADTYVVNKMFPISANDDPTGTVLHARKKLLVPGCRTGGKTFYQDIKEARDTLNRFLDLMKPEEQA